MKKIFLYFTIILFMANISKANETDSTVSHSPRKALILSGLIPAGGQFYNQKKFKGSLLITAEITTLSLCVYYHNQYQKNGNIGDVDRRNQFIFTTTLIYLYTLVDAYVDAHLFEYDRWDLSLKPEDRGMFLSFSYNF